MLNLTIRTTLSINCQLQSVGPKADQLRTSFIKRVVVKYGVYVTFIVPISIVARLFAG